MFLLSCEHKETDPKSHFKHTFNIKAKKLNIDTYKLNSFGRMIPFEDHQCIIKENYLGQSLLDKIYYTKDSLQSFAELGEGPDENIMPRLMQKKDKSSVNIFDLQKKTNNNKRFIKKHFRYNKIEMYASFDNTDKIWIYSFRSFG